MHFRGFTVVYITTWIATVERRPVARGGSQFGSVAAKKIQLLKYWVNNHIKRGIVPSMTGFDAQELVKSID